MNKALEEFIKSRAGKFVNLNGNPQGEPQPDEPVVIVAGFWEEMPQGAMQGKCAGCQRLVGIDPLSQKMLSEPGKVLTVLCRECWWKLREILG